VPELPEVELMTRNLRAWGGNRRLIRAELIDPRLLVGSERPEELVGGTLDPVWRRGKHCLGRVGDRVLMLHFRMTGKLICFSDSTPDFARAAFTFEGGASVALVDRRRLGELRVLAAPEVEPWLATRLGPEPWPERRDGAWWAARMGGSRSAIKVALMDQRRVAGLGNIAGSEVCFRAGLDPRTPARRLGPKHWRAVDAGARGWIEDTLAAEQGPEIVYVEEGAHAPNPFAVYGREGEPCPRCGEGLKRIVQSGRSTFFCGGCQRRLRRR